MATLIVLDAAVLIAALDETHPHHQLAARIILTDDELVIHTLQQRAEKRDVAVLNLGRVDD
ncbi:hypothetical protein [Nesterenkonia ebinurensis]|uniref:hypothetical protein n=1 Tax=Nesterenkonia ebinurensis TaxID=2608252 RepID=UPI00123DDEB0|nr:hypothetical protein [Nesterenkonia ebinurensis]